MTKIIPKWQVSPAPEGRYRSFEKRGFPLAEYQNGATCARIRCGDSYNPSRHKDATDLDLQVWIAVWGNGTFKWKTLKKRASSIKEAKLLVSDFLNGNQRNQVVHPDYIEVSDEK